METTLIQFIQGFTFPAVVFLVLGLGLMVVEMFTPGFGVSGGLGITCLIVCIILRATTFTEALWMTVILLAIIAIFVLVFLRSATKGAISKSSLILKETINEQSGYISEKDLNYFIGKKGAAHTTLRPSGIADFDGVRLDVVTDGEFLQKGDNVEIVRIEGRRIVVRLYAEDIIKLQKD